MSAKPKPAKLPSRADDMFCFSVYSASHVINRAYAPLLRPLGLTYPQYIALTFLWEQDGLGVGDLSRRLKMESSTVTPLLKRLQQLGHIERKRGTEDERQVFVTLTESGKALKDKAPRITACVVESTGLEPTVLEDLVTTLSRLTDNLMQDA
ncbi:MAG: MarR family transcriptional regulator [Alphaproteobacteria bacterium]|nr:MarR family transcriptional regulator [Alphaproteobacteria bacterium]